MKQIFMLLLCCLSFSAAQSQSKIGLKYSPTICFSAGPSNASWIPQLVNVGIEYQTMKTKKLGYGIGLAHYSQTYSSMTQEDSATLDLRWIDNITDYHKGVNIPLSVYFYPHPAFYLNVRANNKFHYSRSLQTAGLSWRYDEISKTLTKPRKYDLEAEIGLGFQWNWKRRFSWKIGGFMQANSLKKTPYVEYLNFGGEMGFYYQFGKKK